MSIEVTCLILMCVSSPTPAVPVACTGLLTVAVHQSQKVLRAPRRESSSDTCEFPVAGFRRSGVSDRSTSATSATFPDTLLLVGSVTDAKHRPIAHASILFNADTTVETDEFGRYHLLLPTQAFRRQSTAVISVHKLGYRSEARLVLIALGRRTFDFVLKPDTSALSLTPLAARAFRGSLEAPHTVYVIDGSLATSDDLEWLSPEDIQSIELVKVSSAAAMYEPRSSGEIVITTRRGIGSIENRRRLADEANRLDASPWPPPQWTERTSLPPSLTAQFANATLGTVADSIESALRGADYQQWSIYPASSDGFLIVTRPERIDSHGYPATPRFDLGSSSRTVSSIGDYFRLLLFARPGRFRIIMFVLTPHSFSPRRSSIPMDSLDDLARSGPTALTSVRNLPVRPETQFIVLVYEFERASDDSEIRFLRASSISPLDHLLHGGLWTQDQLRRR
jgi:hypothetical protein